MPTTKPIYSTLHATARLTTAEREGFLKLSRALAIKAGAKPVLPSPASVLLGIAVDQVMREIRARYAGVVSAPHPALSDALIQALVNRSSDHYMGGRPATVFSEPGAKPSRPRSKRKLRKEEREQVIAAETAIKQCGLDVAEQFAADDISGVKDSLAEIDRHMARINSIRAEARWRPTTRAEQYPQWEAATARVQSIEREHAATRAELDRIADEIGD